jgi:leucyl-tRNA synthetase
VINPDDIIKDYGADTLRMYEMFLGPIEMSKPWDTNGIDGIYKFLRKFWRLYHDEEGNFTWSQEEATKEELKILHKTIKKAKEDIEQFAFNTAISAMMICLNELKTTKKDILEPLIRLIAPFAPHMAEELWHRAGNTSSVVAESFPEYKVEYLKESSITYPVSFNGKVRFQLELPIDIDKDKVEEIVKNHENAQRWLEGKEPRKIIFVPKKIINVVV